MENVTVRNRHSQKSVIAAIVCGAAAIVVLMIMCMFEAFSGAQTELPGIIATVAALVSVMGLIWSVISYYERDISIGPPIAGMIVNALAISLYAVVFFLGKT
ncbi:MAG: hypothetical protein K6G81_05530 [Lachnospiraceae bacterium]|nr:hypothetical protein [Lachnospiraceae bacterium]